ncbi:hypothetical protein, partial [Pseudomonas synxantha]|uniref:hypothetical protein n=1 Tax=Pseudomonas synxantha TaxID=47883 RepID=UPI001E43BEDA
IKIKIKSGSLRIVVTDGHYVRVVDTHAHQGQAPPTFASISNLNMQHSINPNRTSLRVSGPR